jgi:hypothetical protein
MAVKRTMGCALLFLALAPLGCSCGNSNLPAVKKRSVKIDNELVTLSEQGWTDGQAEWFYNVSQGSHLVPYDWFCSLENDQGDRFASDLARFGYIPRNRTTENPDGLPIGFAKDVSNNSEWVGLTCAACHTGMIEHGGKSYLVDGGPGMGDFEELMKSLAGALKATREDSARFDRFAKSLNVAGSSEREKLKEGLKLIEEKRAAYNKRNLPEHQRERFGFGRVDAFGAILNEVTVRFIGVETNHRTANAPVSYPCLWDAPHHDKVQWNGVAKNPPGQRLGDLARNTGEVLGVFGDVHIPQDQPLVGYASTVQVSNLRSIETQLRELKSPLWPFEKPDSAQVAAGEGHFRRLCHSCHTLDFKRDDPNRKIIAQMGATGTDPLMSRNFRDREALTGKREGAFINFIPGGDRFGPKANGEMMLVHTVVGTILGSWKDAPPDELEGLKRRRHVLFSGAIGEQYKARPLNGVWATAPYLHNGSVPTLRDLLKPSAERPTQFWVGSRRFNIRDVGFESSEQTGASKFDVTVPGNSNKGHEYGTGVAKNVGGDGEKRLDDTGVEELLAFLKTL